MTLAWSTANDQSEAQGKLGRYTIRELTTPESGTKFHVKLKPKHGPEKRVGEFNDLTAAQWNADTYDNYVATKLPKEPKDKNHEKLQKAYKAIARWRTKKKRAENAIEKLEKTIRRLEKKLA